MEGVWKFNPFYWMALGRMDRANQNQKSLNLANNTKTTRGLRLSSLSPTINPLHWSSRTLRIFFVVFFIILAPIYFFACIQPVSSIEAAAASYPELSIPGINLSTPVAPLEMTDRQLIAPATIAGSYSQSEHKTFIIGHSSTVFRKLNQSMTGQTIHYNDAEYIITSIDILRKADIDMNTILAATDIDTLVLMTCAGTPLPDQDATHRLIITAERQ